MNLSDFDEILMERKQAIQNQKENEKIIGTHTVLRKKYEYEAMHRRGYTRVRGKWTKVSTEFKPHYEERKSKQLLYLDCVGNP